MVLIKGAHNYIRFSMVANCFLCHRHYFTGHRTTRQTLNHPGGDGLAGRSTATLEHQQRENIPPAAQAIIPRSRLQPPTSRVSLAAPLSQQQAPVYQQPPVQQAPAPIVSAPPITQPPNNAANSRRSYVVKEVERLKENREKRRARQAEIKEEKVALMNMDPGNPNWELAAMIRYVFLV